MHSVKSADRSHRTVTAVSWKEGNRVGGLRKHHIKKKKMMWTIVVVVLLATIGETRLVFPPGSDMGYIVPDDPRPEKYDDDNWLNEVETEDDSTKLLQRGAREALDQVKEALWHTAEDRAVEHKRSVASENTIENDPVKNWHGKWFPHAPGDRGLPDALKDDEHGVAMGVSSDFCDNAKVNLTVDWDNSPINYTCFDPKNHRLPVQASLSSVQKCVDIPKGYRARHVCMFKNITYDTTLPTYGSHRPLWPVYGEYQFLPVQRWLHSLEHGAIVMLYDPCAEPALVHHLHKLLTGCFRKHIISPYTLLTRERPLALLAWGCSLEMATVNEEEVKKFIKTHALHGPEGHYPRNGSFKEGLIKKGEFPKGSEGKDKNICPE